MIDNSIKIQIKQIIYQIWTMALKIPQGYVGLYTRFGKYIKRCPPGLQLYVPFADKVILRSTMVQYTATKVRVKTDDNVNVTVEAVIHHKIKPENVEQATFGTAYPEAEMLSFIRNGIRDVLLGRTFADVYKSSHQISETVENDVAEKMKNGITIERIVIDDIIPDKEVLEAMNRASAAERDKTATINAADARYYSITKDAEANAKAKEFAGVGTAKQRDAVLEGLSERVEKMIKISGMSYETVLQLLLKQQELEMRALYASSNTKVIVFNDSVTGIESKTPSSMKQLTQQMYTALETSQPPNVSSVHTSNVAPSSKTTNQHTY